MARTAVKPAEAKGADLARLVRMVTESQSLTSVARAESLTDLDYYHAEQWTETEKLALAKRGQPDIVINRTRVAINGILGVTEQGKSEPRAFPRTPKDEESADVATDLLRFVADENRFSRLKQDVFTDMLIPGSGGVLIGVDGDLKIRLEQIRWEELIYDPKSRRRDFSDGRYMGIAKWMYADDAAGMYPDKKAEIHACVADGGLIGDASFQDRPDNGQGGWTDKRQRRLLVVELYYRETSWKRCVFHAGGVLEEGESPYQDDKGQPCNPIEAQSAYVDRHNNRYGAVRDMRGPQDEINKRRSKLLHLVSTSQIEPVDGMAIGVDVDTAREEAARPDGVIPPGYRKVQTTDMASGQSLLLQEAKAELERMGPNPAVLGRQGADSSGRALLARQQAGMVELAVLFGGLEDWELRVYRQIWSRAKQFWTAAMWIRVTDDEDAPKFIGLNQPKGEPVPVMGPDGQPKLGPDGQPMTEEGPPLLHPDAYPPVIAANDNQFGQYQGYPHPWAGQPHPEAGQPVLGYKNQLAEMDVDITIDSMPDTANIQAEQFKDLVQLVGSNPAYAQQVPFEVMLELSAVPHKRQIRDKLKAYREEQGQAQAQQAQIQQKLMLDAAKAKIDETTSKAGLNQANTQLSSARAQQIGVSTQVDASLAEHENARDEEAHAAHLAKTSADIESTQVQTATNLMNGLQPSPAADPRRAYG